MPSVSRLRFKTATSFGVSLLGVLTGVRLFLVAGPLSLQLLPGLLVAGLLAVAGFWRGWIYLRALRGLDGV